VAEARQNRSELLLIHVMTPVIPIGPGGVGCISPSAYDAMEKSARAWAQKQMDRLLAKAKAARIRVRGMLTLGVAHEQIVRAAKRPKAGVIIMGTSAFVLGFVPLPDWVPSWTRPEPWSP
jgi:hypothetical protein